MWRPVVVRGITIAGPSWGDLETIGTMPANLYGLGSRVAASSRTSASTASAPPSPPPTITTAIAILTSAATATQSTCRQSRRRTRRHARSTAFSSTTRHEPASDSPNSNALLNARFQGNGHFGASPFAIYRYKGAASERCQALAGVVFENTSFEYCGNGLFFDEPGTGSWTTSSSAARGVGHVRLSAVAGKADRPRRNRRRDGRRHPLERRTFRGQNPAIRANSYAGWLSNDFNYQQHSRFPVEAVRHPHRLQRVGRGVRRHHTRHATRGSRGTPSRRPGSRTSDRQRHARGNGRL